MYFTQVYVFSLLVWLDTFLDKVIRNIDFNCSFMVLARTLRLNGMKLYIGSRL